MSNITRWPEVGKALSAIRELEGKLDAKQDALDNLYDVLDARREEIVGLRQDNALLLAEIATLEDSLGANAGVKA